MQNSLSPARWPSLAQDLAIMNAPSSPITDLSQIFSAYDIDEPTLCRLLTTPKFQVMVKTAMQDMRALGNKAAHVPQKTIRNVFVFNNYTRINR